MSGMVLDPLHSCTDPFRIQAQPLPDGLRNCSYSAEILRPIGYQPEAGPIPKRKDRLARQIGSRIPRDGEIIYFFGPYCGHLETGENRLAWKTRPVLDAPEPLLLDRFDQLAVAQQNGGDISMVGVDAKNN